MVSLTRWEQAVSFEPGNPVQRIREPFSYQPSNNGGSSPGITSIYFNPVDAGGVNLITGGPGPTQGGISGTLGMFDNVPGGGWSVLGAVLGLATGALVGWKFGR